MDAELKTGRGARTPVGDDPDTKRHTPCDVIEAIKRNQSRDVLVRMKQWRPDRIRPSVAKPGHAKAKRERDDER
jgi:hypothetical protein